MTMAGAVAAPASFAVLTSVGAILLLFVSLPSSLSLSPSLFLVWFVISTSASDSRLGATATGPLIELAAL